MDLERIGVSVMRKPHPGGVKEFVRRLTEGTAPWGTLDVSPASRGTWQQMRLTVYPPGITSAERCALHLIHTWPVTGAILGLFEVVLVGGEWPIFSLVGVLGTYLGVLWILAQLTHDLHGRCQIITAAWEYIEGEQKDFGNVNLLRETASRLVDLEARRRAGTIDPVGYEVEWARVYDSVRADTVVEMKSA